MDKHQFIAGIIFLLIGVIAGFRFIFPEDSWICRNNQWIQHGHPSSAKPTSGCELVLTPTISISPSLSPGSKLTPAANLMDYKNTKIGFSLVYPKDISLNSHQDGSVTLIKNGPSQKTNAAFVDGISINIVVVSNGAKKNLLTLAQADLVQKETELSPDFAVVQQPSPFSDWYKIGAFAYKTREPFGEMTYYYLPINTRQFLLINTRTPDPKNLGFASVASAIVESVRIP